MNPRYPLYVVSKSRQDYMITSKSLTLMGVKHFVVVEPDQAQAYRDSIARMNLLAEVIELDMSYKEKYQLLDNIGLKKSTGPGPARNFVWEHSIKAGHDWHWVMDDNIRSFRRLNKNEKVKVSNGAIFAAMEDFVLRYKNIAMAGPNYYMFAPARNKVPAIVFNTRIYSCNFIRNDVPFRWRGRYNEDTILSLDMLKAKWCTVQFNAFLQEKIVTQAIPGGNTKDFYSQEGTINKSRMLVLEHPDVSKIKFKFRRWHHYVDYGPFKKNKLILKDDVKLPEEKVNDYGMSLLVR